MKAPLTSKTFSNDAGISVLELLIVFAMIAVLSGFALIQIVRARQLMIRANAAQELLGYLEKARLDSVRRRPATTGEMAQVQIVNATFYSVTIDADGNGTLDAPRVKSLPANTDLQFTGSFPRTIYFNWRGRTVNSSNAITTPASITISSATYGSTTINVSDTGQAAIGTISSSPVSNSNPAAPTLRDNTQIP
jgi:type II secretory pathway pseudopilin PulG